MYLREQPMGISEQMAFTWTVGHNAWQDEEEAGVAEGNFDSWVPYLMSLCVELCQIPTQRSEE